MPDNIDSQFSELKRDIRDGFKSVNERIDGLVTRNELKAELRRIDEKHEAHASETQKQFELRDKAAQDRDDQLDKKLDTFSNSVRWAVGIGITASTIVLGLLGLVIQTFLK